MLAGLGAAGVVGGSLTRLVEVAASGAVTQVSPMREKLVFATGRTRRDRRLRQALDAVRSMRFPATRTKTAIVLPLAFGDD